MSTSKKKPKKPKIPSYRLHKQSGQGIVTLTDGMGGRRDVMLGKYNTPESLAEWKRVVLEWETRGWKLLPPSTNAPDIDITELVRDYWFRIVEPTYRHADGTPTSEVDNIRLALRPLKALSRHRAATQFDAQGRGAELRQLLVTVRGQ